MSETLEFPNPQSRLDRVRLPEQRPVVLPFPPNERAERSRSFDSARPQTSSYSPVLSLVRKLCQALNAQRISYCHWKSNWKLDRWLAGNGDLDLLVDRADVQQFLSIAGALGFKQAEPPANAAVVGTTHLYGWDSEAATFVHLHVYYQLVVGHDLTTNYHLPIEKHVLNSATVENLAPVPSPELEIVMFVLRKVLGYSAVEVFLRRLSGRPDGGEKTSQELRYLEARTDSVEVCRVLSELMPGIDKGLFDQCLKSLQGGGSLWERTVARRRLQKRLEAHARRPSHADAILKTVRLVLKPLRERLFAGQSLKRFQTGGGIVAVTGGDGAGKTTVIRSLNQWLSANFKVKTFHFGKPPRSPLTLSLIIALRIRNGLRDKGEATRRAGVDNSSTQAGYLQLMRWVGAARDRHRVYLKARRFVSSGGIAICDRFLLPEVLLMDGPNIAHSLGNGKPGPLARLLLKLETDYYQRILPPDLLIVLRVDPEVAVLRKHDENESHVRSRSQEIWELDWQENEAEVIDAHQTPEQVVAEVQSLIWQRL